MEAAAGVAGSVQLRRVTQMGGNFGMEGLVNGREEGKQTRQPDRHEDG